jgi:DNA repair exonuclease SbcCD ATPase subunit
MGYLPKYRQDPLKVHYIFRDELLRCDTYGKEACLLSKNHVSDIEDLMSLKSKIATEVNDLMDERYELRRTAKRNIPDEKKEELRNQVADLTDRIKELRTELKLIDDIVERSGILEEKAREAEKERKEKEMVL